jgi:vacuolar-type H+-ATPase subunit I/STV1
MIFGIIGAISELKPNEKLKFRVPEKLRNEKYINPFELFDK